MSDYRRIVSYIYRYENGVKSTNEGYVRLEIRDGQLKCTVHITSQPLRDALVKVYFYVRKGDSITGILLGEMNVSAGNGDFKETTEALSIMGTGAALEDTGGMILSYVPNLFYATEWDDRPVTKEDMAGVTGAEEYGSSGAAAEEEEDERIESGGSGNMEMTEAEPYVVSAAEESPGWEGAMPDGMLQAMSEPVESGSRTEKAAAEPKEPEETGYGMENAESHSYAQVSEPEWSKPQEEPQTEADTGGKEEESDGNVDAVAAAEYTNYQESEALEEQSADFRDIGTGEPESEWDDEYKDSLLLQESAEEAAAAGQAEAQVEYYTYGLYGRLEPTSTADQGLENGQGRPNLQTWPEQQPQTERQIQPARQVQPEQQMYPGWQQPGLKGTVPQSDRPRQAACAQRIPSPADCGCSDREPERVFREGEPFRREQMDCSRPAAQAPAASQPVPEYQSLGRSEHQGGMPQPAREIGAGCECGETPVQPGIHNPVISREPAPQPIQQPQPVQPAQPIYSQPPMQSARPARQEEPSCRCAPQPEEQHNEPQYTAPQYTEPQYTRPSEQPAPAEQPQEESKDGGAAGREALLCSLDEKPLARTMLDNFPKISPFQDTEIAECVRIVPQNIGLLPIDAWVLGNNSFLQHGYYNHKHLIFAKKYTRSGIMYLLGVPGYFTQRERNMARMFGFNNFKSAKMRPVQNGEFGYWYVPIVF